MLFFNLVQAENLDPERVRFLNQVRNLHLGDLLPAPSIQLEPAYLEFKDIPSEYQTKKGYDEIKNIFKKIQKGNLEKAYLEVDHLVSVVRGLVLYDYAVLLKSDLLFALHFKSDDKKLTLALEDYRELLDKKLPPVEAVRLTYQMALAQFEMSFYQEAMDLAEQGIQKFPDSPLRPRFHLIIAEAEFKLKHLKRAEEEWSYVLEKYPRSQMAVQAGLRKAFFLFQEGKLSASLETYESLSKYHSYDMLKLQIKKELVSEEMFLDRIFYAEVLYLNHYFEKSGRLFQNLANIFPQNTVAPWLWIRFADTNLFRGQTGGAEQIYKDVLSNERSPDLAKSMAKLRLSDLYFITRNVKMSVWNEKILEEVYADAQQKGQPLILEVALAKLANFFLYFRSYPKAQATLKKYLFQYPEARNSEWAKIQYVKTIELEIESYLKHQNELAALLTYLNFEKEHLANFYETKILFLLANTAENIFLYELADKILNQIVYLEKTSSGRQKALLKLIQIQMHQGKFQEVAERLRRFHFAYPQTTFPHLYEMYWGHLYSELNNSKGAIEHYEKALKATRGAPDAIYDIRETYFRIGEHYEKLPLPLKAIESYKNFIHLVEEKIKKNSQLYRDKNLFFLSHYRMADLYFELKDYVYALDVYQQVEKETPQEPFLSWSRLRMGACYLALHDRTSALEILKKISSQAEENLWTRTAQSYIQTIEMEKQYGITVFK